VVRRVAGREDGCWCGLSPGSSERGRWRAGRVGCHPRTVRQGLHRFNTDGFPAWRSGGPGRPRRIGEQQRSQIVALVKTIPPGRLRYERGAEALVQADETRLPRIGP
jgi:hypothetical protein